MTTTELARAKREPARPRGFFARVPAYAWLGLALNIFAWVSSWQKLGFWWPYTFFPLWFGFILALDGLNVAVNGTSLALRSKARFAGMFAFSCLFWWAFEGLNLLVHNWSYRFDHAYSPLESFLWMTLDFSTVLPAVMEIVELVAAIPGFRPRLPADKAGPQLRPWVAALLIVAGAAMLVASYLSPRESFPFVWLCLIFLLDPIANLVGRKSASAHLLARDWRFFLTVPLATLICGYFWEMWNSQALPGWTYTIPYITTAPYLFGGPVPRLFEMPWIGFSGYLPFGVELFTMYQFLLLAVRIKRDNLTV